MSEIHRGPLDPTYGRLPAVDYWVRATDWNDELVYEGPAPCPPDLCTISAEDALAGRLYSFEMTAVSEPPKGLWIQGEPWHWRWDRPHRPRRCLLCWVERLAVALGRAHLEEPQLAGASVLITEEEP